MDNCKKTSLRGIAQNDNLNYFRAITLNLASFDGIGRIDVYGTGVTLHIDGEGVFCSSTGTISSTPKDANSGTLYLKNIADNDKLLIKNKYNITSLIFSNNFYAANTTPALNYLVNLQTLRPNNYSNNMHIDLNSISKYSKDLTTIDNMYNSNCIGDIETIVENLIALGRSSGSLAMTGYETNIKLNDTNFFRSYADRTEKLTITFGNNSATCTWKGNTVASYDGSTWTYNS